MRHPSNYIDLTGQKFNYLTVIGRDGVTTKGQVIWKCRCDCGNITRSVGNHLKNGRKKSCGCKTNRHYNRTHGMSKTRIYHEWLSMRKRCNNENDKDYYRYGGRGIKVCDDWNESFERFYEWAMNNGYQDNLTIERLDNDKGYNSENCKWIPMSEQSNNREFCRLFTYNGKTQNLHRWCLEMNVDYKLVNNRINALGWDFEKAILTPKRKVNPIKN
jgi:hypothetical protein